MSIRAILFDLDGTLLPMDQETFSKAYFGLLAKTMAPHGYEPKALVDAIWAGIVAMVKNDGSCLNEEAFWASFTARFGEEARQDIPHFDAFYRTVFQEVKAVCGFDPNAPALISCLKEQGYRLVLATNPIFPAVATESRIRWAGLSPNDFEWYTTYENSRHCKPNPAYYRDILERLGLSAEECLMVGNDVREDMVARTLGMDVFLLTDCLLNKDNADITAFPNGGFAALSEYIDKKTPH